LLKFKDKITLTARILKFNKAYYISGVKITSTIFLLLAMVSMLYMTIGQMGGVYLGISEAKTEATERIRSEHLTSLTISEADFRSGKVSYIGQNEIRYDGSLYEIASATTHNGITTIKAFHDEKEEGLISGLKDIVDGWVNASPKNTKHHSVKQIVIIKDFVPSRKFTFTFGNINSLVSFADRAYSIGSPLLSVLKSPPKFV
jgi:hypothetical protein